MAFVAFTGQSNMGGPFLHAWDQTTPWVADSRIFIWNADSRAWAVMQPGVNTGYGGNPDTFGPEVAFARDFRAAHPGEALYIVKQVEGGTALAVDPAQWHYDWSPASRDELFDRAAATIAAASATLGGARPDAVFYGQGEEDANSAASAQAYAANLPALFTAIRDRWMSDPDGKIGFFRIGSNPTFSSEVRAAQFATDINDRNADSFDTLGLPLQPDLLHFTAAGYDKIGDGFFRLYQAWSHPLTAGVENGFSNILRTAPDAFGPQGGLVERLAPMAAAQAIGEIVKAADATTSVATMSYQFFTGKIPTQAGVDYLVSPTGGNANNLNSAYYQSFNLENRYINFAVNLGKIGEGKDAFAAHYAGLSLFDATREAYRVIFGATPTDAKVHALIDTRADYFASYGGDGTGGIGTKAAMAGWLLAEAEKADVGVYAHSNAAFLADLADGAAFAVDLVGTYNQPGFAFAG